jgi:hypothetical protein
MTRTTAAALAAAATLVASYAPTAGAAGATARGYAEAVVELVGSDGARYDVHVAALGAGADGTPASVAVTVSRCDRGCATRVAVGRWQASTDVASDLSTAQVGAWWGGGPLAATWTGDAADPGLPGLQVWAGASTVRAGRQRGAVATVKLLGLRCEAAFAMVADEARVSAADDATARSGPAPAPLRPRGGVAPRCA